LDARAASIVIRTVRNTVDTGRTVVCTIHQPSIEIFEAFDELFLMKQGRQEIYVGLLGRHSCHLTRYFKLLLHPSGADFSDIYKRSDLYRRNKMLIEHLSKQAPGSKDLYFLTQYSYFTQFMACLWKQWWSYWQNPAYTAVKFFFTTFTAVLLGSLSWDLGGRHDQKSQDLFNATGSMFTAIISSAFNTIMVEVPHIFVQSLVYSVIVDAMMGFDRTASKFFRLIPGFMIPGPRIPIRWRWYYWANPIAWTLYGLIAPRLGMRRKK
ncbi:hypothetical protein CISIN_1g039187mg, partial [Citrus sinensis]